MPGWLRLTFRIDAIPVDDLIVCLHEAGTLGVQSEADRLLAWFSADTDPSALESRLSRELGAPAGSLGLVSVDPEPDGFWQERWVESLRPLEAGRRLLIVPGPATPPDAGDRLIVRLTPGRAFGTGEHCTTRMCLELLEETLRPGDSVLDVGTGSGILAIAAARLGAGLVVAIDHDPDAVATARTNATVNETPRILFVAGGVDALRTAPFELVLANLTGTTIERLMTSLSRLTAGRAVLSGILRAERDGLRDLARRSGFRLEQERSEEEWIALGLTRVPDA